MTPRAKRFPSEVWLFLRQVGHSFSSHRCGVMAAATSYYALLSLLPLCLLAVSIFGHVLGSYENAHAKVAELVRNIMPGASEQILGALTATTQGHSRWFVNSVGLLVLLWSGLGLVENLSVFLSIIWIGKPRRHFLIRKLVAVATIVATGLVFFLSLVFASLLAAVRQYPKELGAFADYFADLSALVKWILPLLITTATFFLAYRFLPAAQVKARAALVGAVSATLLWSLSRELFGRLVVRSGRYGELYGPLSGVVILMLWVYYSSLVFLFCGEIAVAFQRRFWPEQDAPSTRSVETT